MAALEGNVKVPIAGEVPKKELAIGGAVVLALIVVYYVRQRQSASSTTAAAAAASTTDQYPPDGTVGDPSDPYSTDPATNETYGDEAVGAGTYGAYGSSYGSALDQGITSDSYPWDGTYSDPSDPYSMDPSTGETYGDEGLSGTTGTQTGSGGPPFSTNEQWVNWVLQQEQTVNPSVDIGSWQDALGLYINGQPVSPAQQQIIFDAIAIGDDPPVPGPNNYPPNVQGNGTKGGATTVTVPNVVGNTATVAGNTLKAAGLVPAFVDTSTAGATNVVTSTSPAAGAQAQQGSTVNVSTKVSNTPVSPVPVTTGGGSDVTVPATVGETATDAGNKLKAAGFGVAFVDSSAPGTTNIVTATNPPAGAKAAKGSTVNVHTAAKK